MEMSPGTLVPGDCLGFVNIFHHLRFLLISWLSGTQLSFQVYNLDGGMWLCSQRYVWSQVSPPDENSTAPSVQVPGWKSPGNTNHCRQGHLWMFPPSTAVCHNHLLEESWRDALPPTGLACFNLKIHSLLMVYLHKSPKELKGTSGYPSHLGMVGEG